MNDNTQLKKATIKGMFWTLSDFFLTKGISFIIQLILARILLPEHFGLIGMILIVIAISQSLVDSGMQNALIREKNPSQVDFSTVFYFNFLISLLIYLVIYIISPFISLFYKQPELTFLLRVLSVVIIINSFSIVQRTILTRNLNFKTQTIINITSIFTAGSAAIVVAFWGMGVWSLVVQNVINQLVQCILLFLNNKWVPSFVFSRKSFKRLFGFGWKLTVSSLINTIYINIYNVIIGKNYSTSTLGYYTQAYMLNSIASSSITTAVQKVTYPVMSKLQNDESQLLNGYRSIIKLSVFITFPLMVGLASTAETLIPLLFGEKWRNIVPYFQILCFAGMLYPLHSINLNLLQVKGRSDLFLKLEIIKKIIGTSIIAIVVLFNLGVFALVWTTVLNSIIVFFINSYYTGKILNYTSLQQLLDISKIFVCATIMGIVIIVLANQLTNINSIISIMIQIFIGVLIFVFSAFMLKSSELSTLFNLIKTQFKK